jgi:hypothetical protein
MNNFKIVFVQNMPSKIYNFVVITVFEKINNRLVIRIEFEFCTIKPLIEFVDSEDHSQQFFLQHTKTNFTSRNSRHIVISSGEYRHIASKNAANGSSEPTTEPGEVVGITTFPVENGTGIEADIGVASTATAGTGIATGTGIEAGTGTETGTATGVL